MFDFVDTKKQENHWLNLDYLKKKNIDGRGGIRIIDIEKYAKDALNKVKSIKLKVHNANSIFEGLK